MNRLQEKCIKRNDIFLGHVVKLHVDEVLLPDGSTSRREVVDHPGGVGILCRDKEGNFYFVEQFRYAFGEVVTEIPAGKLEKGEDVLECAKRELLEETGITGKNYVYLGGIYVSPGFANEITHMYYCEAEDIGENNPDEGEFLNVIKMKEEEIKDKIDNNMLRDAKTVTSFLKAKSRNLF